MDATQQAKEMRHAIDMIEGALMGCADFVELPRIFEGSPDSLQIAPKMTVGQMRRVCTALEECTRIVNSDDYVVRPSPTTDTITDGMVEAGWTSCAKAHPKPHAKYLVRRGGYVHTVTPCYGMHAPWWVAKLLNGDEASPFDILPTDEWMPLTAALAARPPAGDGGTEADRLRWALEEIIQAATPGSPPWAVIPDHLIEKARAALRKLS